MTEEQKKKCEEIYNLHIDFPLKIRPIFLPKFGWVKIAMLLAEVFNKNITEEEAGEIFDNIFNNIGKMNCVKAKAILLPIGINLMSQSYYKDIFWKIANYFDNGNKEANKINNVVENTAKEKIMTEEQKKKCEEIINSYKSKLGDVDISLLANPFSSIFSILQSAHQYVEITHMTISLAKVFNKDVSEEEAKKIIFELKEDLKENRDDEKYKDFESISWAIVDKLDDELILNLLILGKTGTGKSSLVNALVGEEVAKVGDAEPETEDIYPYSAEIDGKKIIIHDSWGMEVGKEDIWDDIINKKLKEKGIDKDIKDWFHSVTYCIQAGGNRIEDFDAKIITKFIKDKYNVIVALTKAEQMGKEDREKFTEKIKERIKKEIEKEDAKNDIIVVSVSASPKKLDYMTEAPKPYGIEEYKAAILISWREIFINRIPIHIIEKLKKDIENSKSNAPKEGKDLEKLAKEIQKYFINVVKEKVQNHVKDNFEKYYKITEDILVASKNIDISNLNMYGSIDDTTYIFSAFDFDSSVLESIGNIVLMLLLAPLTIVSGLLDLISLIAFNIKKSDKINEFINEVSQKIIDKISEEEFESEIRKIIINALNEIDKKIIKLN
ncbi:hypothetical protein EPJ79_10605 [Brachyspira aalborgi]|uniref:G domain-containing protein n=1 Tax=Brachyspira aalborgi TaxID=29522 RepID=A0A5C8DC40_9SPIR|nr:GTPase [Brachyspira aalborgi]TXJ21542.1 hypothetical protein EPJ79_10605 [Brachyspira aalborgi]